MFIDLHFPKYHLRQSINDLKKKTILIVNTDILLHSQNRMKNKKRLLHHRMYNLALLNRDGTIITYMVGFKHQQIPLLVDIILKKKKKMSTVICHNDNSLLDLKKYNKNGTTIILYICPKRTPPLYCGF